MQNCEDFVLDEVNLNPVQWSLVLELLVSSLTISVAAMSCLQHNPVTVMCSQVTPTTMAYHHMNRVVQSAELAAVRKMECRTTIMRL